MLQAHRMAMRSSSVSALRSSKTAGLRRALHSKDYKVIATVKDVKSCAMLLAVLLEFQSISS
jgi:hypothetical protein